MTILVWLTALLMGIGQNLPFDSLYPMGVSPADIALLAMSVLVLADAATRAEFMAEANRLRQLFMLAFALSTLTAVSCLSNAFTWDMQGNDLVEMLRPFYYFLLVVFVSVHTRRHGLGVLTLTGAEVVQEVTDSGLRGRGGAAFPTGIKWKTVLDQQSDQKYVVCNADEGDSGTFSDRMLMEGDPLCLIEGMTIAGVAVGATQGYIYLRCEYPHAQVALEEAIAVAKARGFLGRNVCGSGKTFELEVRMGAGAYICGEETSLLESLEGKRAEVRYRPPLPAIKGLFGKPTVINNVISLASLPVILQRGGAFYRDFGMGRSRGTLPIQLAGNIKHGGLVEKAFGVTLRELLYDFGGGSASGRPIRAVQVGGPLGAYIPEAQFDTPLDYEAFAAMGALVGHGGIVAFDDTADLAHMARYAMEFCAHESCGKCTPCRIGSTRGVELIDRIIEGKNRAADLTQLADLCETMQHGSLCGLGGMTQFPVMSAVKHFPDDFARKR